MKKLLIPILLLLSMIACKQDVKKEDAEASAPAGKVQLICEKLGDTGTTAVYTIIAERKTKIMEINAACMEIRPESYAGYGIPDDALAVLGSWFAGIGDFFYAKEEGEKIVIYYSAIGEEGPPGGIHTYYPLAIYENGKITVQELQ